MTFLTCAQLISRIKRLEQDCLETMGVRSNVMVEQLRIINPGVNLVTEGAGPFYQVVEGNIMVPKELTHEVDQPEDDV